jgi:hypothetical protein
VDADKIVPVPSGPRPLVVTWCGARKRRAGETLVLDAPPAPQAEVQAVWRNTLLTAKRIAVASDLYVGRAFRIARDSAQRFGADFSIASAGLGWLTGVTRIPAYDLTLARNALSSRISDTIDVQAWWTSVCAGPFSTSPSQDLDGRPLVLACVSQEYATIFSSALERVPLSTLRIFGSGIKRRLPENLQQAVMPYDDRLAAIAGGTRSDFAQRALRHFLFTIVPTSDPEVDRAAVAACMVGLPEPLHPPKRLQRGDAEIVRLIKSQLSIVGARRTPMLRHLRDVLGIACEQGRFARLFDKAMP